MFLGLKSFDIESIGAGGISWEISTSTVPMQISFLVPDLSF